MDDPDPEPLDLLRSRSGLAIDDEGRFLHRGTPITHARTLAVLWASLRRTADGRYEIAIGRERAFVEVANTPFAVRGLAPGAPGAVPRLLLTDGTEEPLAPESLALGRDGVLRCVVKGGFPARFTRAGQLALGAALEEDPPGSERFVLKVNGQAWPIALE